MSDLQHLTASQVTDAKVTAAPLQRSATGYGPKLPTAYMLRVGTRWHRVYVVNYGNAGSTYVSLKGQDHYLTPGVELILETVRDGGTHADALAKMESWPQWARDPEGLPRVAVVTWPEHLKGQRVELVNSPAEGVWNTLLPDGTGHVFHRDNLEFPGGEPTA